MGDVREEEQQQGGRRRGRVGERPNVHLDYDTPTMVYHRVVARAVLERVPAEGLVMDLGCGTGQVLVELRKASSGLRLHAADIDPDCLAIAARRARVERTILVQDGVPPEVTAAYDAVILSHVLEHVDHPTRFLRDLLEWVRPGGFLVVAVPNPVRPNNFINALFRRHYVNPGHRYAWDRSHWINFLEGIMGLEVETYLQDYVPVLPFVERVPGVVALETALARLLPWLAFSNIAVIRRP